MAFKIKIPTYHLRYGTSGACGPGHGTHEFTHEFMVCMHPYEFMYEMIQWINCMNSSYMNDYYDDCTKTVTLALAKQTRNPFNRDGCLYRTLARAKASLRRHFHCIDLLLEPARRQGGGSLTGLIGRRFAAALLPRLFGTNPRSHHKGATGRVRTGDQRLPVLCHCHIMMY